MGARRKQPNVNNNQPDAQEPDESPTSEFPQGIKWYGDWENALRWLPRGAMMPVQVWLTDGTMPIWMTVSRDWRPVVKWRRVQVTQGCAKRLRTKDKVEAQELEQM